MATANKNEADKNLPAPLDAVATAAKAREARHEAIFAALKGMSDAEDSQWEPNGMPKITYLSSIVGGDSVTYEELGSVVEDIKDIQRRPWSPEDNDEDATPEMKETARLARLAATRPMKQMNKTLLTPEMVTADRARLVELDATINDHVVIVRDNSEALALKRKERDIINARLSSLDSNNHSEVVKAYQASEHRVNQQRADDLAAYRRNTGGYVPGVAATPADANKMNRRALKRRFAR